MTESELRTVSDEIVPAKRPWSGIVRAGRHLRIVDLEGRQAVDFLCYSAADPDERYSAPNTIKAAGTVSLTRGHVLYSDLARPLFTIVEDTYGSHDTIGRCCSAPSNRMLYSVEDSPGCRENFLEALAAHGMGRPATDAGNGREGVEQHGAVRWAAEHRRSRP